MKMNVNIILVIIGILIILFASVGLSIGRKNKPTIMADKARAKISIDIINERPIVDLKIEIKADNAVLEANGLPLDGQYLIRDIFYITTSQGGKIPMNDYPSDPEFDFNQYLNPKRGDMLEYKIDLLKYYNNVFLAKDGEYKVKYSASHEYPFGFHDKKTGTFVDGTATYLLESNEVVLKKAAGAFSVLGK